MRRAIKGNYGYLKAKKQGALLRTLVFFFIPLSLLIAGIVQTGSKENLLTVVAVLGFLPASKSLVGLILLIKAEKDCCSPKTKQAVEGIQGELAGMYDMYFTSYKKNFPISHMVVEGKNVCAYTENPKCDTAAGEEHLSTMLKQGGYRDMTVKIFSDLPKYCERLKQLNALEHGKTPARDDEVRTLFYEISL